jgi:hypothetical protein
MSTSAPTLTTPEYPADYIELTFTTDEQTLADNAVLNLQATWAGWEPNDGDVEIVLIETLAPYATEAARQAAAMPPAAFIALCTKLYGIPYQQGAPATTTVTLTFQDTVGGYYVPAGSEFDLSGYAFSTVLDVTSVAGSATATGVQVVANDVGVAFNGLTSVNWSSVTLPVWVTNLATEAATTDGVDPQDDYDYLNMASRELQLRGRMLVTCPDLEIAAVNTPGVGRAYAQTTGPRAVEITLVDPNGEPVSADVKSQLLAMYQAAVLVNVSFTLSDATYTAISVDYEVMRVQGFDSAQLQDGINSTLSTMLSPMGWGTLAMGQPGSSLATFIPDNTVRLNKIISTIGNVVGVAYVVANSVKINGAAADFTMSGTVAMPTPGTMTGIIDTPTSS